MPGSTGKTWLIVQYAWHLRGSLDKNTGFSSLGHTFRLCIDTLYSSIHVGRNLSTAEICMLVKHQTSKIAFLLSTQNCSSPLSFFSSKPSTIMARIDSLLWVLTSNILCSSELDFGLSVNIPSCEFHKHWSFLHIARCLVILFMIAIHKTPHICI